MSKISDTDSRSVGTVLRELTVGTFKTIRKIEQGGALQARKLATGGIQFYWRYTHEGKTDRVAIGTYDSTAAPKSLEPTAKGYSIAAAAEECRVRARIHESSAQAGGYREHVVTAKKTRAAAKAKEVLANEQTLQKLMDAYCDHLEAAARSSHADVRSIFKLHVTEAWPGVAAAPASSLSAEQVTDMLRKLIESGKGRTANKLRAYLRAAFQCALDVNSIASIPATFKTFQIAANPAALTKRNAAHDKADKHPLSVEDLQTYWRLLKGMDGVQGAALRLHLVTGGQRIEQLIKLKKTDVSASTLIIYDAKGRPGQGPRRHTVPLLPPAAEALRVLVSEGDYVMSTNRGKRPISAMTMTNWARAVAASIPDFQLKRVRSGVETALASVGVSREVRGQLQSHGLSGVQARHYDAYDYMKEKQQALQALMNLLEPKEKRPTRHVKPVIFVR